MNFELKDKKILIIGSSGGIGKALSDVFVKAKCQIIFTSSDELKLENLRKDFGNNHLYYFLDLSNSNSLFENIKKITDENKDIEILINNAGITKDNLILRMKKDQWNDVININLNSNFHIIKSIIPNMIKSKPITVIFLFDLLLLKKRISFYKCIFYNIH